MGLLNLKNTFLYCGSDVIYIGCQYFITKYLYVADMKLLSDVVKRFVVSRPILTHPATTVYPTRDIKNTSFGYTFNCIDCEADVAIN